MHLSIAPVADSRPGRTVEEATLVMVSAAWHGRALPAVPEEVLALSRRLARRHLVERRLLETYPERFAFAARHRLEARVDLLWANLQEAGRRLRGAGVEAVFIKSGMEAGAPDVPGGRASAGARGALRARTA